MDILFYEKCTAIRSTINANQYSFVIGPFHKTNGLVLLLLVKLLIWIRKPKGTLCFFFIK
jgi:hypothetical protein